MKISDFFKKSEELIAIDIGSGAIKMAELIGPSSNPVLESFVVQGIEPDIMSGNNIAKPEQLAEIIEKICIANEFGSKRAIVSIPAPAVFTKRIKMLNQPAEQLRSSVQFEAGNFIPHKLDAVRLDYAVLGESGKNQLDLLVVAVKRELLDSIENCLALAGLELAVADVDFFAVHNAVEANYTLAGDATSAFLNFGNRYSSLTISRAGIPVFVGDISIGLKNLEEDLSIKSGISETEIRQSLCSLEFKPEWTADIGSFVEQNAQEINRQISFFWNTCGIEGSISKIFVSGVGTFVPELLTAIQRKSGIVTEAVNPFLKIAVGDSVDKAYLNKIAPLLTVAVGLGVRAL